MICETCGGEKGDAKFRGDDYGILCNYCYEEQYDTVHLDEDEESEESARSTGV